VQEVETGSLRDRAAVDWESVEKSLQTNRRRARRVLLNDVLSLRVRLYFLGPARDILAVFAIRVVVGGFTQGGT
jgi:hypothetical protein